MGTTFVPQSLVCAFLCASLLILDTTTARKVFSWGRNNSGQLARGDTLNQDTPILSTTINSTALLGVDISIISVGVGTVSFVTAGREIYCYGANAAGQCGLGHNLSPILSPARIDISVIPLAQQIQQIAVGYTVTAILTSAGELYTTGEGQYLGDGSTSGQRSLVAKINSYGAINNEAVTQVCAGIYYFMALTQSNKLLGTSAN